MTDERAAPSRSFLGMFEALRMGPALARGRRDVRAGHVRQLTVSSSLAVALVRGPDEDTAARARIAVRAFGAAEWSRVEDDLAAQARYVADLLAGRVPPGIERVFADAGLNLLPLSLDEIAMDCTCGGRPVPCAHLAAAIQALAASFDSDPFGMFAWRGRGRDELLLRLREARGAGPAAPVPEPAPPPDGGLGDLAAFWGTGTADGASAGRASGPPPGPPAAGGPPFGPPGASMAGPIPGSSLPGSSLPGSSLPGSSGPGPSAAGSSGSGSSAAGSSGSGSTGPGPSGPGPSGPGPSGPGPSVPGPSVPGPSAAGGASVGTLAVAGTAPGGAADAAARPDALLDQLDPPPLTVDGRPLTELLRPAYLALPGP